VIFFKLFEDKYGCDDSCVDVLNEFLAGNPDLKVVSVQMMQCTVSNYGFGIGGRWNPENTRLASKILVQFEK
jgi:hypothetical protein